MRWGSMVLLRSGDESAAIARGPLGWARRAQAEHEIGQPIELGGIELAREAGHRAVAVGNLASHPGAIARHDPRAREQVEMRVLLPLARVTPAVLAMTAGAVEAVDLPG